MIQHAPTLARPQQRIQGCDGHTELEPTPQRGGEAPAIADDQRDCVSRDDAAAREQSRHASRSPLEGPPGQRAVFPDEGRGLGPLEGHGIEAGREVPGHVFRGSLRPRSPSP